MKCFIIMNHTLNNEQKMDLEKNWGVTQFVPMPEDLKSSFASVPPEANEEKLAELALQFEAFLSQGRKEDLAIIQGEPGLCFMLVLMARTKGLIPIYATTERESVEKQLSDGRVKKQNIFRHVRFRKYMPPK